MNGVLRKFRRDEAITSPQSRRSVAYVGRLSGHVAPCGDPTKQRCHRPRHTDVRLILPVIAYLPTPLSEHRVPAYDLGFSTVWYLSRRAVTLVAADGRSLGRLDWIEQGLTSHSTHFRSFRRWWGDCGISQDYSRSQPHNVCGVE